MTCSEQLQCDLHLSISTFVFFYINSTHIMLQTIATINYFSIFKTYALLLQHLYRTSAKTVQCTSRIAK
jgi:hypothetical protein